MASLHKEISFEEEICAHLAASGWLYVADAWTRYDRVRAVYTPDLAAWVEASQPDAWAALTARYGADAAVRLAERVRVQCDALGVLTVLRHGVEMMGVKGAILLAQFRPAFGTNAAILARYAANRLRVVRQLHYSTANENSIDLGLFLNGIPVGTCELKTDFTQSVADALDQYRFDRHPKPKGGMVEPLLSFPGGALVHFAVSNREAHMTTRLAGKETIFLPFNKGDGGGAGNPPNPGGHRTAYLWEEVWQRDRWLEIIGRYLIVRTGAKKAPVATIFPRYHQLDATRALRAAVLAEGAGGHYLIQHSAGSGKTNSIAWTAHFLADLHDAADTKMFGSVIVVSDRNVIDAQLQEALSDFQRTQGVVETITSDGSAKSQQLADALAAGKKIIVCTIQTFPFALAAVRELAAAQGKRFAVIADEAHSSQTGEAAAKLKEVLSPEELAELADGGEVSTEDILAAQMAARAADSGITYVAFTATPKAKTLELFGRRPKPDLPAGADNLPAPFHVYSMRQAIEEGFILDVLKNYTPYKLAFKLAHDGGELDETTVEKSAALKGIMRWVRLHPYNISQKVEIVVEHFRSTVAPLLDGKAKAMVVLGSRVEAVRWQIAVEKYIKSRGYVMGTLVAFSGEVNDGESGSEPFTEKSASLNAGLKGRDIREAFKGDEFQLLLVANKFQTGFDQPLLCGMYIDRRLAGIQAVQTLSRLNRAHPGKDTTYVLDFVNSADEILTAFRAYFDTAELAGVTDPNLVYDLRAKLDAYGHYDDNEIDRVVAVEMDPNTKQSELFAAIEPVADRLLKSHAEAVAQLAGGDAYAKQMLDALALFKNDIGAFQRAYSFLSQIFDYGSTAIEKRFIFFRRLLPLLDFGRQRTELDLSRIVLTHYTVKDLGQQPFTLGGGEKPLLAPLTELGSGAVQEKESALLSEIVSRVNDLFEGELSDDDKLVYVNNVLKGKLLESQELIMQATNNSKAQFSNSPTLASELMEAIIGAFAAHTTMSKQALDSDKVRAGLKDVLLGPGQLWETLRAAHSGP
jgi:type I restriction enzyme R subunit